MCVVKFVMFPDLEIVHARDMSAAHVISNYIPTSWPGHMAGDLSLHGSVG